MQSVQIKINKLLCCTFLHWLTLSPFRQPLNKQPFNELLSTMYYLASSSSKTFSSINFQPPIILEVIPRRSM